MCASFTGPCVGSDSRPFSAAGRDLALERLGRDPYDLLVIGGGITGAGVARDAAMRGLRVALVEKGDFASSTSSRSSKLLHGGLRYLEQYEFKLVWEACHERSMQSHLVPHLAEPVPFVFPLYHGHPVGPVRLDLGLWLYDAMAGASGMGLHRTRFTPAGMLAQEPRLRPEGLRGGSVYVDGVTDDARLTLENVRSAWDHGADAVNYVEVVELVRERGRVVGARVRDVAAGGQGGEWTIRARCVVNATGPFSDRLRSGVGVRKRLLRPTKGVHLVMSSNLMELPHAVVMLSPEDRRILFVIPWRGLIVVGTTDTDYDVEQGEPTADEQDVEYILRNFRYYFPGTPVRSEDVLSTFAGLRPLVHSDAGSASQVSREHVILEDVPGLVTVAGGKLTTYRVMARQVVDAAVASLRRLGPVADPWNRCRTASEPVVEGSAMPFPADLAPETAAWLHRNHGPRAGRVAAIGAATGLPAERITREIPDVSWQAGYAAAHEMALHLPDVMLRRTMAFYAGATRSEAEAVAGIVGGMLKWDERRRASEVDAYTDAVTAAMRWRRGEQPVPTPAG